MNTGIDEVISVYCGENKNLCFFTVYDMTLPPQHAGRPRPSLIQSLTTYLSRCIDTHGVLINSLIQITGRFQQGLAEQGLRLTFSRFRLYSGCIVAAGLNQRITLLFWRGRGVFVENVSIYLEIFPVGSQFEWFMLELWASRCSQPLMYWQWWHRWRLRWF